MMDSTYRLWRAAWLAAYSRGDRRLLDAPIPEWALVNLYEQERERGAT